MNNEITVAATDARFFALQSIADLERLPLTDSRPVEILTCYLRDVIFPLIDQIHESLDPVCTSAYLAHKEAVKARADLLSPLEETVRLCEKALAARENRLRLVEESAKVSFDPEDLAPPLPALPSVQQKGVQVREEYSYEVVDAGAVKRQFLILDHAAIKKAIKKHREHAAEVVGGIRVTKELPKVKVRR